MRVNVNGIELYYEMLGSGPALIMLHGNREDHTIFYKAAELLKERYTLYLIDSRCHGNSSDPETLTYNAMSDDLIEFTRALNLDHPLIYGYSDGGITALYAACKISSLFSGIIVSGANSNPRGLKRYIYKGLKLKTLYDRDKYDFLMLKEPNIKISDLERISIPSLIIAGEKDVIKKKDTEFIASNIKNSKLLILKGEDHGSYIVNSDKIANVILSNWPID